MGYVPEWSRQSLAKAKAFADGGEVEAGHESGVNLQLGGGSMSRKSDENVNTLGGRLSYRQNLGKDSSVEVGVTGAVARGKSGDFDVNVKQLGGADLTYAKKDTEYGVSFHNDMTPEGKPDKKVMLNFRKRF